MTGDVYDVPRVDALGDTTRAILAACAELHERGVRLRVAGAEVDTRLAVLLLQAERDRRSRGTRAGLAAAADRGHRQGAPAKLSPEQVAELRHLWELGQYTAEQLAARFQVSRITVVRNLPADRAHRAPGPKPR